MGHQRDARGLGRGANERSTARAPNRSASEAPECELSLGDFWHELRSGSSVVIEHFFSPERCHTVLRRPLGGGVEPRDAHDDVLLRMVLGQPQKAIALELGISCPAVTLKAQRWLKRLGLGGRLSLLPLFVVMAAVAFDAGPRLRVPARLSRRVSDGEELHVLSFMRPDGLLPAELSEAEQQVSRLLVEGKTFAAIARCRGTTPRTAANQIGSIFAKLGVSGRLELIRRLAERSCSVAEGDHSGQQ